MSGDAESVAAGWLAQSFRAEGRDWRDVPLCIRSRSTAFAHLERTAHD